jgi:NADPH:quinone reductase
MRAILCDHFAHYSELAVTDVPPPEVTDGRLKLAIKYATVGFGTSLHVAGKYQRKLPLPFVPGTEVSGIVTEVGSGVQGFAAGDRVVASLDWGGFAEEAIATASTTWHVPAGISLLDAVSVPQSFGTSYAALHWRARIKPSETLVVFGAAGGVGLTAVQLGRLAGAKVIAVAGSKARAKLAVDRGAHVGLVHGEDDLAAQIKEANDGSPVDIVFDPVGQPLFAQALRCVRPEGRILLIGFASGQVPSIPANLLLVKNIDVIGFNFGLYVGWGLTDERERYRGRMKELVDTVMNEMAAGKLQPLNHTVYPLERFVEAFDSIIERRSIGRAVLALEPSAGG